LYTHVTGNSVLGPVRIRASGWEIEAQ